MIAYLASLALLIQSGESEVSSSTAPQDLTLEQTQGRGEPVSFRGDLDRIRWARDGVHLERKIEDETRWVHPLTGAVKEPEPDPEQGIRDAEKKALQALFQEHGLEKEAAERAATSRRAETDDGTVRLHVVEDDLYVVRQEPMQWTAPYELSQQPPKLIRLTRTPDHEEQNPALSPDGQRVSFVVDGNLYVASTESGEVRAITKDGGPTLLYGRLDWVYQEELYGRGNFNAMWWSPDSTYLAFLRIDEAEVGIFTVVDHIPYRLEVEETPYPKAGDPNPTVALCVLRPGDGKVFHVDLSKYKDHEFLVVRVGWTPESDRVMVMVQDREQRWLDLSLAHPETGELRTLFREESESWVNITGTPRWLEDGSFLWLSDATGYRHISRHARDGKRIAALTSGPWDVRSILNVDEATQSVEFTGKKHGAIDSHVYRVSFDGRRLQHLTPGRGTHQVTFNEDRSLFLDQYSSLSVPPQVRLCRANGEVIDVLASADIPDLEAYGYSQPELLEIPTRDGFKMDATILKPRDFNPNVAYPVWLATYSGPNAPSVRNRWNTSTWFQFLAQQGMVVFQVNNRTSSGKGMASTSQCYQQFGVKELEDLEDALAWLCSHPWADASRVGITGWSYGGFMAAYALTHSKSFRLGIAGAGVYDWRDYDTIYTERYMRTPQNNPDGYERSSVVAAAKDLHGHLVLVHGTMDDNVHMQNVIQFVYELQKAGKEFDLMLYPRSRHGVRSSSQRWHLRQLEWKNIRETLLQPTAGSAGVLDGNTGGSGS